MLYTVTQLQHALGDATVHRIELANVTFITGLHISRDVEIMSNGAVLDRGLGGPCDGVSGYMGLHAIPPEHSMAACGVTTYNSGCNECGIPLTIDAGVNVTLIGLIITGGRNTCGPGIDHKGGGIMNSGNLALINCTVTRNMVGYGSHSGGSYGGGVYNAGGGSFSAWNSTFSDNIQFGNGDSSGISCEGSGTFFCDGCTFDGNNVLLDGWVSILIRTVFRRADACATGWKYHGTLSASAVTVFLPLPPGYYLPGARRCEAMYCQRLNEHGAYIEELCPPRDQICDYDSFAGQYFTKINSQIMEPDWPPLCTAGYSGDSQQPLHQLSSICAGPCPQGYQCPSGVAMPFPCPRGTFCPGGAAAPLACQNGSYCPDETSLPSACDRGYFCPNAFTRRLVPAGHFAAAGSTSASACGGSALYCPGGEGEPRVAPTGTQTYTDVALDQTLDPTNPATRTSLRDCPPGFYCEGGLALECPTGYFCRDGKQFECAAGKLGNARMLTTPECNGICPPAHYCPEAATAAQSCPQGTVGEGSGLRSSSECTACPAGYWCNSGRMFPCSKGYFTSSDVSSDLRIDLSACLPCPPHSTTNQSGSATAAQCICDSSFFLLANGATNATCAACPTGLVCTQPGTTLTSLQVDSTYWKPGYLSTDAKPCPHPLTCQVRNCHLSLSSYCTSYPPSYLLTSLDMPGRQQPKRVL